MQILYQRNKIIQLTVTIQIKLNFTYLKTLTKIRHYLRPDDLSPEEPDLDPDDLDPLLEELLRFEDPELTDLEDDERTEGELIVLEDRELIVLFDPEFLLLPIERFEVLLFRFTFTSVLKFLEERPLLMLLP
jgi:hypothetical protein